MTARNPNPSTSIIPVGAPTLSAIIESSDHYLAMGVESAHTLILQPLLCRNQQTHALISTPANRVPPLQGTFITLSECSTVCLMHVIVGSYSDIQYFVVSRV